MVLTIITMQVAIGRREKISVYGADYDTRDGTGDRDYVHVVDLAEGHVKAVDHILADNRSGVHIFNLGTGTGATVLEVIKAFAEESGKEIKHEVAGRRKGDVDSLYASCDKAEKVRMFIMMMMMMMMMMIRMLRSLGGKLR